MPDAILTRDGPVSVPQDYTVPNGGELLPLTVRATIDGTGAASAFYAAVQVLAPSGRVMGSYITKSIAAGASADVTWFPGVSEVQSLLPLPGQVLALTSCGGFTVSDFTTNSTSFVNTGFPTNTSFTKVSSTSVIGIYGEADFTTGASPDVLYFATFIDGVNHEATGIHVSSAGSFATAVISTVLASGSLLAGAHTINVRTACNSGSTFTMRTSSSVDLTLVEYEPPA